MNLDSKVCASLAPGGRLRLAINFGNAALAQRDATGNAVGVAVELAQALGRQFAAAGLPFELIGYDAAGKLMEGLGRGEWDVGFLAVDPVRAEQLAFTPAYVQIAACYVVHANSSLQTPEQVDTSGRVIAVGRGAAYDLHLSRALRHARLERHPTAAEAFASFDATPLDAAAGVRRVVQRYAEGRPHLRVMSRDFLAIAQALCVPRGRADACPEALAFLHGFVEDAKRSGMVAEGLARSGQTDAVVAPPHASS